jgi:hypothetical protein
MDGGVAECEPASPYTLSSSTHRFPDEITPIEATPLSATSAELGSDLGLGLGLEQRWQPLVDGLWARVEQEGAELSVGRCHGVRKGQALFPLV